MENKKYHKLILLIFLATILGSKLGIANCIKANEAYEQLHFSLAIEEFEKCLDGNALTADLEKLANAYRILGNLSKASSTYARIRDLENMSIPAKIEYAYLLRATEDQQTALNWVEKCLAKHKGQKELINIKELLTDETKFEENRVYTVNYATFNSPQSDYCPSYHNGNLVFSSTRLSSKTIDGYTSENFSKLYIYDTKKLKVVNFAPEITGKYNIGATSFSKDGKEMYFTKNREKGNKNDVASFMIMQSKLENEKWSTPISFEFNREKFNFVHPTISPNGQVLVFSSDSETYNGMDLYFTKRKLGEKKWSVPTKLPNYINTYKDEVFPVFLSDSVLVFSSEGHIGMGGLDMYTIQYSNDKWSFPVNLGQPFNSTYDDYGLISDDGFTYGYFTSTRENDQGTDNIYSFAKHPDEYAELIIHVVDKKTGLGIPNVGLVLVEEDKNGILFQTDSLGKVDITIDLLKNSGLIVAFKGEIIKSLTLPLPEQLNGGEFPLEIIYDNPDFVLSGKTVSQTGEVIPNVAISITEDSAKTTKVLLSDDDGEYNLKVKDDTDYTISGRKENYFSPTEKLSTADIDRTKTFEIDKNMVFDKAEKGKIFTLKNIYYDFDKWNIRPDAAKELDHLVNFLNDHPNAIIELSSHTDARGNDAYNLKLSQNRAESALSYLIEKGIKPEQVTAKGFGETQLVNHCGNNVKCNQMEHQENRRTEVKILQM